LFQANWILAVSVFLTAKDQSAINRGLHPNRPLSMTVTLAWLKNRAKGEH